MKTEELEPIMVGKKTAAQLTGLSVRNLEYLIAQKKLAARKIGRRARRDTPVIEKPSHPGVGDGQ